MHKDFYENIKKSVKEEFYDNTKKNIKGFKYNK
jgi:hypothetical protein